MARIQLRRDSAINWTTNDTILAEGEIGVELDTNKLKVGDGTTTWTALPYVAGEATADGVTSVNTRTGDVVLTKTDVGLDQVDNTADADKPVSTATQTALDAKLSDAPSDTKQYARKDGAWAEVATAADEVATYNTEDDAKVAGLSEGDVYRNATFDKILIIGGPQIPAKKSTADAQNGEVYYNQDINHCTIKGVYLSSEVDTLLGDKIGAVVEDTTPQLGGDLDVQNFVLTSGVDNIQVNKDIVPVQDGQTDLGSSTQKFKDVFVEDGVNFTDKRTSADSILSIRDGQLIVTDTTAEVTTAVDLGGTTPDPGHFRNVYIDGTGRYAVGPSTLFNTNGFITREFINSPGQFFVINDIDGGVFTNGNRQGFGLVRETIVDGTDLSGRTEGLLTGGNSGGWSTGPVWYYTGGYPYLWTSYSIAAQTPQGAGESAQGTFSSQLNQKKWWEACTFVGVGKKYRVGIADGANSCKSGTNYSNRLIHQLYVPQEVLDDPTAAALMPSAVTTNGEGWYTAWATSGDYENMGTFPADSTGFAASRQAGQDKGYRFRWSTFGNTTLSQLPYVQGVPSINDQIAAATGLSYYLVYEPTAADKAAANVTLATGTTSAENPFYNAKEVVLLQFQQPVEDTDWETDLTNVFAVDHTDVGAVKASPLFTTYDISDKDKIIESGLSVQGIESIRATVSEIVLQSVIGYYMIRQLSSGDRDTVRTTFAPIIQAASTGQLQEVYDLVSAVSADPLYPQELLDAILEKTSYYLKNYPVF